VSSYTILTIGKTNIRFRRFTNIEIAEAEYLQALEDGWSTQTAAAKAGLSYGNLIKCLHVRPKMLIAHLEYIDRTDHSRSDFIYDKYLSRHLETVREYTSNPNYQASRRDPQCADKDGTSV
jgi:hypothetical protein